MFAVDLGEGWAVVAYWFGPADHPIESAIITNGGDRSNVVGSANWNGNYQGIGLTFDGGNSAQNAAIECLLA